MLEIALSHRFGDFALDVELHLPPGLTVLFGRSGSGKSSVIKAVAGLLRPDKGRIVLQDRVLGDTDRNIWLPPHKRGLGVIFQEGRLFPHLTVRQNLLYGQRRGGTGELSDVVDMLGIGDLIHRRPAGLSGGEQQRVAIGRALLANPGVILADEPLAALDEARKGDILPYFEMLRDRDIPILYVTHSPAEVARLATQVVVLDEGRVLRQGTARDVLGDPALVPAGIRGVGAVLEARVARHHDDGLTELDASGVPLFLPRVSSSVGDVVRIRIAAQEVILSRSRPEGLSALNILPGHVDSIRSGDGPGALVALRTPAGRVLARVTQRSAQALGLTEGVSCHAVVKTVAIAPEDIGRG
ncbi:molybdenum ABC transporter ATP-binding protein [Sagittula sp. NFXS13]|uniref:molybdenum ABC transporter ATP-binding protein n=1 Tax=Sagittula sp. NFXS13 TaxID=2819095 RepID=UPI0032DF4ED0